jgi:hypothetical protein
VRRGADAVWYGLQGLIIIIIKQPIDIVVLPTTKRFLLLGTAKCHSLLKPHHFPARTTAPHLPTGIITTEKLTVKHHHCCCEL